MYQDGMGFVPGNFPPRARVLIIGQNPGADEEDAGRPFVGRTGQTMEHQYLPLADLQPHEIAVDNAIRCRLLKGGHRTNDLPAPSVRTQAVTHCAHYDTDMRPYELVILQGGLALEKYRPDLKLHTWRGHLLPPEDAHE